MLAIVLAWLSGYLAVRYIRRLWLMVITAIAGGVGSALMGAGVKLASGAFGEKEIVVGAALGVVVYPCVALLAAWVHRGNRPEPITDQGTQAERAEIAEAVPAPGQPAPGFAAARALLADESLEGWKRLVIAVAAAWLLGVGYFAATDITELLSRTTSGVEFEGEPAFNVVVSSAASQEEIDRALQDKVYPMVYDNLDAYRGTTITVPYDTFVAARKGPMIAKYLKLALLPLGALALLVCTALWVRKGFKR